MDMQETLTWRGEREESGEEQASVDRKDMECKSRHEGRERAREMSCEAGGMAKEHKEKETTACTRKRESRVGACREAQRTKERLCVNESG